MKTQTSASAFLIRSALRTAAWALLVLAVGCGGTAAGTELQGSGGASGTGGFGATGGTGGTSGGPPCSSSSDCSSSGGICAFAEAAGCGAQGRCVHPTGALCNAISPGCACDGTMINLICNGLPTGYVTKPLRHTGQCSSVGGSFACGSSLTCDSATQYCKVGNYCCGAQPTYSCQPIPSSCANDHTCNCIETAVSGQECSESGGVTVQFDYP